MWHCKACMKQSSNSLACFPVNWQVCSCVLTQRKRSNYLFSHKCLTRKKESMNKTINVYMYRKETCVRQCFKLSDYTTNYSNGFRDSYIYIYYLFLWIFKDVYMSWTFGIKENRKEKMQQLQLAYFHEKLHNCVAWKLFKI